MIKKAVGLGHKRRVSKVALTTTSAVHEQRDKICVRINANDNATVHVTTTSKGEVCPIGTPRIEKGVVKKVSFGRPTQS